MQHLKPTDREGWVSWYFGVGSVAGGHDTHDTDTMLSYACMLLHRIMWVFTQMY